MNLDQRSLHLNTEIGLIIESPELARQIALRFAEIAQPANSYVLMSSVADGSGRAGSSGARWKTDSRRLRPGTRSDILAATEVDMLSMLPLDELL